MHDIVSQLDLKNSNPFASFVQFKLAGRAISCATRSIYYNVLLSFFIEGCLLFCQLQEGVFTNLHQLKTLVLDSSSITTIEPRVFDESANLSSLSHIDLSNNNMAELEPWPLIRAQHRPMTVALASNRITRFTNVLQWSFNCSSTRVFDTQLDLTNNDIHHITDIMNGWNISGTIHHVIICPMQCIALDRYKPLECLSICLSVRLFVCPKYLSFSRAIAGFLSDLLQIRNVGHTSDSEE